MILESDVIIAQVPLHLHDVLAIFEVDYDLVYYALFDYEGFIYFIIL